MMSFRTITQAIITLLGENESSRFQTIGYKRQAKAATEIKGTNRMVQVFLSEGVFPKAGNRWTGPVKHEPRWTIELSASAPATVDLATLNDTESTAAELATAIAGASEAAYEADQRLDELAEIVYQILMDGLNVDLGLDKGVMSSRWIDSFQKDAPQNKGSLVVITGSLSYSCVTSEDLTGDTGVEAVSPIFDITVDIDDDDVEQTGVIT